MTRLLPLVLLPVLALATPALAQAAHDHSQHEAAPPAAEPAPKPKPESKPAPKPEPEPEPKSGGMDHDMSAMPGMPGMSGMPGMMPGMDHSGHGAAPAEPGAADPHAGHGGPAEPAPDPHAGHNPAPAEPAPADPHAGHAMPEPAAADDGHAGEPTGADLPVGDAAAPPVPTDRLADRLYDPAAMARAKRILDSEHGGARFSKWMSNLLEHQGGSGADGYRWDAQAAFGGDFNRFVVKTEGEGAWGSRPEAAEIQALYSRAVGRYTDLQLGLRQDVEPKTRTYLAAGFESLLPYWFELEGTGFLSDKGDVLGRVTGTYDLRLAQRLVLQPRAELNLSAQDIPRQRIGSGLSSGEFGLRLRYEIKREFAPYVGVSYERRFGDTADYVRAAGEKAGRTSLVVGLRAWF